MNLKESPVRLERYSFLVPLFLIASFFSVPISSTAKSIFIALSLISIVSFPAYRANLRGVFGTFWCQASLLLFFIALIACFWSPASMADKMLVLEKYSKLLYLPVLLAGLLEERTRKLALHAFLLAMSITCLISLFKFWGFTNYHGIDSGRVFRNHIMTGFMMAFAAYLSAVLMTRSRGRIRLAYISMLILFSYQVLFVNTGRTGYVIYIVLMGLLVVQYLSWRQAVMAVVLGTAFMGIIYTNNHDIHERVQQIYEDLQHYQSDNKNTSVGYRLQFHEYAESLFLSHPILGNGTGSFTYLYNQDKPVPAWSRRLWEPHSQYWLIAAEFGLLGLFGLTLFFGSLLITALQCKTMRPIAIALLIPFMIGNLSDSLLFYSGTGYLLILFMAMCISENYRSQSVLTTTISKRIPAI